MKDILKGVRHGFEWRLLALHLIYFALLLWVYTTYIVDIYTSEGYIDALNINKAEFALLAIIAAFALLRNNGLPSYLFLNITIALTVTPSLVIFSGSDLPYSFIAVTWIAFAILAMVARFFRLRRIRTKPINASKLLRLLAGLSLLFIASVFAFGGGRYMNFNLSLVYIFRRAASENLPEIFGYLMSNFARAIIPLGIVLSLLYRRWVLLLIFIFCSVMIFGLSSNKGPLFIPFVIIFIYWFSKNPRVSDLTLVALIAVVLIGGLDFYLKKSGIGHLAGWFGTLTVRRSILVSSLLDWDYLQFFSVHPYTYWAESKFTLGLLKSPYDLSTQNLIGLEFFRNIETNANTGWIGSGMANAGYFGIALYSVLIGLLFSLLDAYVKKMGSPIVSAVFLIPVMTATRSADLTSMLLTQGLLVLLILFFVLKPPNLQNANALPVRNLKSSSSCHEEE